MNKSNSNTFEQLTREILTQQDFDDLKSELGSPHMRTKILLNPSIASFDQLLLFAEMLQKTALDLFELYHLGASTLTEREARFLKEITYKTYKNGDSNNKNSLGDQGGDPGGDKEVKIADTCL